MFWNNLCRLCNDRKTTPNAVSLAIGKTSATATKWKNGAIPRDTTLHLIADYFGITVEDLLRDPDESVDLAKQNLNVLFDSLTSDKKEQLMLYAKFLRDQK